MDIETITKLLDAGYTKADIDAMQGGNAPSGESNERAGEETTPKGEEQGNAGAENAGKVTQTVDINAAIENLTNTVTTLSNTVKAMQESNANSAATQSPNTSDKLKEVMDSFIESL